MSPHEFSLLLKQEREKRGWSQEQMAKELKTTRVTISRWEHGLTVPTLYFRGPLCDLLKRPMEECFSLVSVEPATPIMSGGDATQARVLGNGSVIHAEQLFELAGSKDHRIPRETPAEMLKASPVDQGMLRDGEIQRLVAEKHRLEFQEKRLEFQTKHIESTIAIANHLITVLDPACDAALRSLVLEELLTAVQQAYEEGQQEVVLPTLQQVREALDRAKKGGSAPKMLSVSPQEEVSEALGGDRRLGETKGLTSVTSPNALKIEGERKNNPPLRSGNPYSDQSTVRDRSMFFGRQHELRMLLNAVEKRQCFSLVGSRHIGKSSLLKFLANRELQQEYGYDWHDRIFILTDWGEYVQKTREDFFSSVCEQVIAQCRALVPLQPLPRHLCGEDRFKRLLEEVCSAGFRPVLLMDVFDRVTKNPYFDPDFFSFLRSLAGIYDLISYVTATIKPLYEVCPSDASSPFFNIFQTCVLSSLTVEETRQLISVPAKEVGVAFTPEEVDWVMKVAGRHPFYVQVTSRYLFDEKMRQGNRSVDFTLLQERVYHELKPHFVQSWNDLSEDQKQSLRLELTPSAPERLKLPELSECSLFRKNAREFLQVDVPELSLDDLKEVLNNIEDNDFLEHSKLALMHSITLSVQTNPQAKKGVLVRDLLRAGFERMRAGGIRTDSAPEWRLYNILWYHYFKYHLPNGQTSARLGFGSMRQFYREQERALQVLLKEILDLEHKSLHNIL